MKKTNLLPILLILFAVAVMAGGCSSTTPATTTQGYTSIEEAHQERFEKTVVGMSIDEFKAIWPESVRSGISEEGEIYEFIYIHLVKQTYLPTAYLMTGGSSPYDYKVYTKFYFKDNALVKYENTKGM